VDGAQYGLIVTGEFGCHRLCTRVCSRSRGCGTTPAAPWSLLW